MGGKLGSGHNAIFRVVHYIVSRSWELLDTFVYSRTDTLDSHTGFSGGTFYTLCFLVLGLEGVGVGTDAGIPTTNTGGSTGAGSYRDLRGYRSYTGPAVDKGTGPPVTAGRGAAHAGYRGPGRSSALSGSSSQRHGSTAIFLFTLVSIPTSSADS